MKKLLLSAVLVLALVSCKENASRVYVQEPVQNSQQDIVVTPTTSNIGENLDLQSLGELVKQSNSAEEIENKLNSSGSINNLDLDGDGNVDYIKVNEVNDGNGRGFVFIIDTPQGSEQVASISLSQSGDVANLTIQGNPSYYGDGGYYTTSHLVRDMMIMNYLYGGYHRPYYSPYRYGYYPRTYRSYRSVPYSSYHSSPRVVTRTTTTTKTVSRPTTTKSSYGNSSYKSKPVTASSNRTSTLSSPKTSQKSFKVTSASKSKPVTSGFGSKKSSSSYSSKPSSSSSSYGSSRKSSGSSYGSGSSSRSSSFGSSSKSSSRSSGSSSRSSSRRR